MDEIVERVENNFININKKFDIIDEKLNNYHIKFHKINEMIDIIISDEYTKIYKTYYPMKHSDLVQDRFFIYNAVIDIPLKVDTFIIFDCIFEAEYINIPLVINLKIDNVLEKNFNIHLKRHNKIRHVFRLESNITKINFYLYLFNNEIYDDQKMEYLKKISFNNKKLNLIYLLLYKCMVLYHRKPINKTVDDVKLKMGIATLTLKLSENNNKIDDLLQKDNEIKENLQNNVELSNSNKDIIETKIPKLERNSILFNNNLTKFVELTKGNIEVVKKM